MRLARSPCLLVLLLLAAGPSRGQTSPVANPEEPAAPAHGVRPDGLWIRNVMVVRGNGTPAIGPTHVVVRDNKITRVGSPPEDPVAAVIDGTGRYLLPGFINLHGHIMESRAGIDMPLEYQMSLWLAAGITTIRDVGSDFDRTLKLREMSSQGAIEAPRIFVYPFLSGLNSPSEMRQKVREVKAKGADGLKLYSLDRDLLEAAMEVARELGLRTTIHIGVEETNVLDAVRLGMTSIEHWYGIPDAALTGVQKFPADFSYSNEVDRFRHAGRLWREVDPDQLSRVLNAMVEVGLAWDPTFAIYEASRDLQRARTKPWFGEYLHPGLEKFFEPNLDNHGSYFVGWTNTDEVYWKENYRIWMDAVREFARRGGVVTTGEDAGFIHVMYGFGYLRELELHEEAGFHPLEVIQHATVNGAAVLGQGDRLGRIRAGHLADLVLVNGNPLENLRLLYPTGADLNVDGKAVPGGTIEWTIKDGIPYHGPVLRQRVKDEVARARAALLAAPVEGGF